MYSCEVMGLEWFDPWIFCCWYKQGCWDSWGVQGFLESVSFIKGRKQDRQRHERGERREGEGGRKQGNEGARLPSVAVDITG